MLAALIAVTNPSFETALMWAFSISLVILAATYVWKKKQRPPGTIRLRDIIVPLTVLYGASLLLLAPGFFEPNSQTLLIIKLVIGALLLGPISWRLLKRSGALLPIIPMRINWLLALGSVILGFFCLYLIMWMANVAVPAYYAGRLTYYGPFDVTTLHYFFILAALALYVFTEELFFRGVVYTYLLDRVNTFWIIALLALAFIVTHLTLQLPFVVVLLALSIITTLLVAKTRTYFYAFLVHASLDLGAIIIFTTQFAQLLNTAYTGRMLICGAVGVAIVWFALRTSQAKAGDLA